MCQRCAPAKLTGPHRETACSCPCPEAQVVQSDGASPRKCRQCGHGLPLR